MNMSRSLLCVTLLYLKLRFALSLMTQWTHIHTRMLAWQRSRNFTPKIDNCKQLIRTVCGSATGKIYSNPPKLYDQTKEETLHNVGGIMCREVDVTLPSIGVVTILEATASSQDLLVNMALSTGASDALEVDRLKLHNGDPYGAVLWPAATALAQYLLTTVTDQTNLEDLRFLELGTGTGLVSLALALAGAKYVLSTDYEPVPLNILKHAIKVNGLKKRSSPDEIKYNMEKFSNIKTEIFDICAFDTPLPKMDIMIAADIMYELKTGRALAHRVKEALSVGTRCIIACSPGRPGRNSFSQEIKMLLPDANTDFIEINGTTCSGPRNELICGKGSTSISNRPKFLSVALLDISANN